MDKNEEIAIELKSEPMNEMLSQPPGWLARSGNGAFLLVVILIIFLTWFIRYPDEVTGDILITSSRPPIELSNQSYIQLKALHVQEYQQVKAGDLMAQFDLQANAKDIETANIYLKRLEAFNGKFLEQIPEFHQKLQLGVYQEHWTNLLSKIEAWNVEHAENLLATELAFIQREIVFREQLQHISGKKITLSENEYALIEEQLTGSERLAEQHAISKQTLTLEKRSRNQAIQTVQGQKEQAIQNLIALNDLRKEKGHLEHTARINRLQKASDIRLNLTILRNSFQNWEKNSTWVAPCSGRILFNKLLQVNQFYKVNEASIVVVPEGSGYLAVASVAGSGAGKLKVGQQAFIELTDYPKAEFGILEGKVSSITQMEKDGKYELKVSLPLKLKTSYQKEIPPKAQLKGKVKIITKDRRLLSRFFEQLTELIQ